MAGVSRQKGSLINLPELRKQKKYFTCDEMKVLCETDYASEMCRGMRISASVENAFQKTCRKSKAARSSKACEEVRVCNGLTADTPECL